MVWGSVEARSERVNLGTVLLAITLIGFYVTEVIARFDRSLTLLGLGLFFFLGGWGLNRLRQAMLPGLPGGDSWPVATHCVQRWAGCCSSCIVAVRYCVVKNWSGVQSWYLGAHSICRPNLLIWRYYITKITKSVLANASRPIILIELEGKIVDNTQGLLVGVDGDYLKEGSVSRLLIANELI